MKYMSRSKDIDIDIADIFGQKYRHRIDIGKRDINPPLINIFGPNNSTGISVTCFHFCVILCVLTTTCMCVFVIFAMCVIFTVVFEV